MVEPDQAKGNVRHEAVILALDEETLAKPIQSYFAGEGIADVTIDHDPVELVSNPPPSRDTMVVVSLAVMQELSKTHAEPLAKFCERAHVMLLMRSDQFLDSTPFLEMVDGVVFEDATLHRLPEAAVLAAAGYSVLPAQAMSDIFTDRLRCDAVVGLPTVELAILEHMRLGEGNRAIARFLSMGEATVKTKVRAILRGLKLKNRTEAAVFAARQQGLVHQVMRRRLEEGEAAASGRQGWKGNSQIQEGDRVPMLMS